MRKLPAIFLCATLLACTAKTPVVGPSAEPTRPSASPSPTKTKPRIPRAVKAVYVLGDSLWLYDVKSDALTEVAKGEGIRQPRWINSNEISFLQGDGRSDAIKVFDVKTREVGDVLTIETGIVTYAWTPDRETVGYITLDERSYPHVEFRSLIGNEATISAAVLAQAGGRELVADDQMRLEFDRKGRNALIIYTPSDGDGDDPIPPDQSQLQVRSLTGELLHAGASAEEPTMGFWSPDGRYAFYRTDRGGRVWTARTGALQATRGGGRWFNPWPSRDGKTLAYDTGATSPKVHVRLLNVRTGDVRSVGRAGMFHPVFASSGTVWMQQVRRCDEEDCLRPMRPSRTVYAVNVKSGKERKLALRSLEDIDVLYR